MQSGVVEHEVVVECVLKVFDAGVAATADALRGAVLQTFGHEGFTSRSDAAREVVWSNPETARHRTKNWCAWAVSPVV